MDGGYAAEQTLNHKCSKCGHQWLLLHVFDGGPGASYAPVAADCPACGYNTCTVEPPLIGPIEPWDMWWERMMDRALMAQLEKNG
jgi:rRNA maturation protein Nop10